MQFCEATGYEKSTISRKQPKKNKEGGTLAKVPEGEAESELKAESQVYAFLSVSGWKTGWPESVTWPFKKKKGIFCAFEVFEKTRGFFKLPHSYFLYRDGGRTYALRQI